MPTYYYFEDAVRSSLEGPRFHPSLIEVLKVLPQSSHDQSSSMRPQALKRDSSATNKALPQCGHLGRLSGSDGARDWAVISIVDPSSTKTRRSRGFSNGPKV
jgi:hypothetical protein